MKNVAFVNVKRSWVGCEACAQETGFLTVVQPVEQVQKERGTHYCDNCGVDLLEEKPTHAHR